MGRKINKIKNLIVDQAVQNNILNGQKDYQRFIFLSTHRSGSTYLSNLVKSHPSALIYSEIYLPRKIIWGNGIFRTRLRMEKLLEKRNADPVNFLREDVFRPYASTVKVVGFKVLYDQLDHFKDLRSYLKVDKGLKTIHLKRSNQLDRLISLKIAKQSGIMNAHSNQSGDVDKKITKMVLEIEECQRFFKHNEEKNAHYEKLFSDNVLSITYSELINNPDEIIQNIQKFLGLEYQPLSSSLVKQNKALQSERVLNYDDLNRHFQNTKWSKFFTG